MIKLVQAVSVFAVVALLAFASCGGGGGGLNGTTWQVDGHPVELSFTDGSKFTMTVMGHPLNGTYQINGNNITMAVDGAPSETSTFTVKGNTLSITKENGEVDTYTRK